MLSWSWQISCKCFDLAGDTVAQWLRRCAASRKVVSSRLGELSDLFQFTAIGPGVYLAFNRNEYQKQKNNVCWE
jgi:hypothetical protein